MADSDNLADLLAQRRRACGAARAEVEATIHARFGRMQAVMFTDLVGFSRLVEAFGILHFLQLIVESEALFVPLIHASEGTVLKREGDSLLAVFDTAAQALRAARAMLAATDAVNPGRSPQERIEVCIGLGYGQVLRVGDQDVWGAEVNAASKLGEEMARGGELLVTEDFRNALPGEDFVACATLFGKRQVFRLPR